MRGRLFLLSALAAVALAIGAVAVASAARTTPAARSSNSAAVVSVRHTKLGRILVDRAGRTLYLFERDRRNHSNCGGACAAARPPLLTRGRATAEHGAETRMLGTAIRRSGEQVTYNGHPLYRYAFDRKAGQTNGEGSKAFGASWYVVAPNGQKIDKS